MSTSTALQIPESWSDAERWAWNEIQAGRIADFNKRYDEVLDPKKTDGWDEKSKDRQLSQAFIATILSEESFCAATTFKGVRIYGAYFKEQLNLQHIRIESQLWLENCRFLGPLHFLNLHVNGWFSLEGSWLGSNLDLNGSKLNSYVSLREVFITSAVDMIGTKIDGSLNIDSSTFDSGFYMNASEVHGSLFMKNQAKFKEVDLSSSKIDGDIYLTESTFSNKLSMYSMRVGGNLFMREGTKASEVDLSATKIDGSAYMMGSTFDGKVNMNAVEIGGILLMREQSKFKEVNLTTAKINGNLEMDGSTFDDSLNMNTVEVGGNLFMRDKAKFKSVNLGAGKISGNLEMTTSTFDGKINMNTVEVDGNLFMRNKAKFKEVDLSSSKVNGNLEMDGSTFNGMLDMNTIRVDGNLFMRDYAKFQEVNLIAGKIGGYLDLDSSSFECKVNMNAIEVTHLFMRKQAIFKEVILSRARIGGNLEMDGSIFEEKLNMSAIEIGDSLFMDRYANFKGVNLLAAKIGGSLDMSYSTFEGQLIMDGIKVDHYLLARFTKFATDKELLLYFANIGSTVDLSGATIGNIDLTSTSIAAEFRIGSGQGHAPPNWKKGSRMVLRNAVVGAIQDAGENSWPDLMELEGFTYQRLGGFGAIGQADIANRNKKWFIEWLGRDKSFSPQPYEYLANMLNEAGYPSKAYAVRYAGRKRARQEALAQRTWGLWIGLTLLQYTIGYGLGGRYFRVLWWFGLITLIGFFVLLYTNNSAHPDYFKMFWVSFDVALPIVGLNDAYEPFIFERSINWVKGYFYIQKLLGYVLGGFLAAGLAGLTQKSA